MANGEYASRGETPPKITKPVSFGCSSVEAIQHAKRSEPKTLRTDQDEAMKLIAELGWGCVPDAKKDFPSDFLSKSLKLFWVRIASEGGEAAFDFSRMKGTVSLNGISLGTKGSNYPVPKSYVHKGYEIRPDGTHALSFSYEDRGEGGKAIRKMATLVFAPEKIMPLLSKEKLAEASGKFINWPERLRPTFSEKKISLPGGEWFAFPERATDFSISEPIRKGVIRECRVSYRDSSGNSQTLTIRSMDVPGNDQSQRALGIEKDWRIVASFGKAQLLQKREPWNSPEEFNPIVNAFSRCGIAFYDGTFKTPGDRGYQGTLMPKGYERIRSFEVVHFSSTNQEVTATIRSIDEEGVVRTQTLVAKRISDRRFAYGTSTVTLKDGMEQHNDWNAPKEGVALPLLDRRAIATLARNFSDWPSRPVFSENGFSLPGGQQFRFPDDVTVITASQPVVRGVFRSCELLLKHQNGSVQKLTIRSADFPNDRSGNAIVVEDGQNVVLTHGNHDLLKDRPFDRSGDFSRIQSSFNGFWVTFSDNAFQFPGAPRFPIVPGRDRMPNGRESRFDISDIQRNGNSVRVVLRAIDASWNIWIQEVSATNNNGHIQHWVSVRWPNGYRSDWQSPAQQGISPSGQYSGQRPDQRQGQPQALGAHKK